MPNAHRTTIQRNPGCSLAHDNLGVMLLDRGQTQDAILQFELALLDNPNSFQAENNLGSAFYKLGRTETR